MKGKLAICCAIVAAMAVSPALAAGKKKMSKRATQSEASMRAAGPVEGAARTTGAVVGGAAATPGAVVGTAGAFAMAPFQPLGPNLQNPPICKKGDWVTINGKRMRCQ